MFFENSCPREQYTGKNLLTREVGEIEVADDRTSTSEQENIIEEGSYENTGKIANNISDGGYEDTDNPVSSGGTETVENAPTDNDDSSQEDNITSTDIEESPVRTTRAGRATRHTSKGWYKDFAMLALTQAEINYQNHPKETAKSGIYYEVAFVGAGLGGVFKNTAELKVMKYTDAMRSDRIGLTKAVEEEYKKMVSNKVWVPIRIIDVPKGCKGVNFDLGNEEEK